MAFPTTSVLDDFNRANTGPPPASSWSNSIQGSGLNGLQVVSNSLQNSGSFEQRESYWNVATFGPDSEVYITVTTVGITAMRLYTRLASPGAAGADGYVAYFTSTTLFMYRMDDTALTQLGASVSVSYSDGDSLGLEAISNAITTYKKTAGGAWASIASRTDGTYTAAGNIGVGTDAQNWVLDDFGGGTIGAAPAASVSRYFIVRSGFW